MDSGQATFVLGDETVVVEAGHVVVGPPDVPHGFTNTRDRRAAAHRDPRQSAVHHALARGARRGMGVAAGRASNVASVRPGTEPARSSSAGSYAASSSIRPAASPTAAAWIGIPTVDVNGVWMTPIGRYRMLRRRQSSTAMSTSVDLMSATTFALGGETEPPRRLGGDGRDDLVAAVDRRRRPRPSRRPP